MPKLVDFKKWYLIKLAGFGNSGPVFSDFQQLDWHHSTHLISLVTDQTKIRRPLMNSLPIALRLYAIVSVVLLLVKLQLHKAAYSYCIVTIYLACVHWHSYCYMILTLENDQLLKDIVLKCPCVPTLLPSVSQEDPQELVVFLNHGVNFCLCHAAFNSLQQ